MTNIEQKALALVNEVNVERGYIPYSNFDAAIAALCRAIEQHEAFRQEVSDAAQEYEEAGYCMGWEGFESFIIPAPKPDPLVDAAKMMGYFNTAAKHWAEDVRAALDALGFEIKEKSK